MKDLMTIAILASFFSMSAFAVSTQVRSEEKPEEVSLGETETECPMMAAIKRSSNKSHLLNQMKVIQKIKNNKGHQA